MDFELADIQLSDINKLPVDEQKQFYEWAQSHLRKTRKKISIARRMAEAKISNETDNDERGNQ
jgi:putative component of toxin-antitoxin plasmid stabilization module